MKKRTKPTQAAAKRAATSSKTKSAALARPAAKKTVRKPVSAKALVSRNKAAPKKTGKATSSKKSVQARKRVAAAQKAPALRKTVPVKPARVAGRRVAPAKRVAATAASPFTMVASGIFNRVASEIGTGGSRVPKRMVTRLQTRKPRLLWIGDALVPTGFATVTHAVLAHLRHDWEVIVSGINYNGADHDLPYQVMPAWQGGDMWGMNRFQHLCAEFDPAAVIINNDWWNVAEFAKIAPKGLPIIGYMPVDGGNLDPAAMRELNKLHAAVWYTRYGHREATKAGFKGAQHVIPHGIDTTLFQPMNRTEARRLLDLNVPKNAFIVGNLNRNQPRKRLDLTIHIFADWVKQNRVSHAYLLLHCAQKDAGWDLRRVAAFHGVADRLLLTGSNDMSGLQSTRHLNLIYNSLDVQMSTTLGEGWGLTTMEGMACGIPQIVPQSSALAEWARPAVKIPCSRVLMHPEVNTTGALVDHEPFVAALKSLHQSKALRDRLAAEGLAMVREKQFQWSDVAEKFSTLLRPAKLKHPQSRRLASSRS